DWRTPRSQEDSMSASSRFATFALLLLAGLAHADPRAELRALFDAEWERGLRENPISATFFGDARYNDRLPDASLAAVAASQEADRAALGKLKAIDRAAL